MNYLDLSAFDGETKVVQVIMTRRERGTGKQGDPYRLCTQLYTLCGTLLAEHDHFDMEARVERADCAFAQLDGEVPA